MLRTSGLIRKFGKGLGEYFLGIETYRFYDNQKRICIGKIRNVNDISIKKQYNNLKRDLSNKCYDVLLTNPILTSLTLLGGLTMILNTYSPSNPSTSKDNLTCFLVGSTTIALAETVRYIFNKTIKKDKLNYSPK